MKVYEYLHLYLGCNTNFGKLIGINETSCVFLGNNGETIERTFFEEPPVKLLLRKISNLDVDESSKLNNLGLSIGRPRGYSFSPEAILYLLSIQIDLFNLIANDMAIEISKGS